MRENESDGAGGWWQSPEQDAGTPRPGPGAASPSDSDYPDTIALGTPPGSPGHGNQAGQGNQAGPGNQGGYGQGYYGHQAGRCQSPRPGGVPRSAGGCWSTWP